MTELHGRDADAKLAELGASLVTDPSFDDGRKPIAGSVIRFKLNTTWSPTVGIGMYQWTFDGPDGYHMQSSPNLQQPDPIPAAAPANGMFVNDYDPNATTIPLSKPGKYTGDAFVRAGVDVGNGQFEGYDLHIERSLDVTPLADATNAAYAKLGGKDKEDDYQKFRDTMDTQMALLRPGGPDKQEHGQYRIATTAVNPTAAGSPDLTFTAQDERTDKSKPLSYHWYVSPQTKDEPPKQFAGKSTVAVGGRKGYDFGAGSSIVMPTQLGGFWVVWYQAKDDKGADVGEASYLQTILGNDDMKALDKYDQYMERMDDLAGKIASEIRDDALHVVQHGSPLRVSTTREPTRRNLKSTVDYLPKGPRSVRGPCISSSAL